MLSATILFVAGPGFGRIPLAPPSFWGFTIQLLVGIASCSSPLFIWDRRTQGKVHPATMDRLLDRAARSRSCRWLLIYTNSWAGIAAQSAGSRRLGRFRLRHAATSFSASCADSAAPSCHRPADSSDARRRRRSGLRASAARHNARRAPRRWPRVEIAATARRRLPNKASGPRPTVTPLASRCDRPG